jgi:HSP20 family protein
MSVMRFDPFRDLERVADLLGDAGRRRQQPQSFPMDAYRRGDRFFVHLDLPGVEADSIDLTSEQNVLTVTAERRFESKEDDQIIVMERPQGTFSRQLFLSEALDSENVEASYDQGVLTLAIPVAERAKPRRIQVAGSGGGPETIEGSSRESQQS